MDNHNIPSPLTSSSREHPLKSHLPAKTKYNNSNSPVSKIPPELLSKIFLMSHRPTYPRQPDGIDTLLRVCRLWRSVTFSTPGLWNKLQLNEVLLRDDPQQLSLLTRCLALSSGLPLFLDFRETAGKIPTVLEREVGRWSFLHWIDASIRSELNWRLFGMAAKLVELKVVSSPCVFWEAVRVAGDEPIIFPSLKVLIFI